MSQTNAVINENIADFELAVYELYSKREFQVNIKNSKTKALCGTLSGYGTHRNHSEPPCDACRKAQTDYSRELYAKRHPKLEPAQCGTWRGHARHVKHKEPPCADCRKALSVHRTELRAATKKPREGSTQVQIKLPPTCGTFQGFNRHKSRKEKPCPPCNAARRERRKITEPRIKRQRPPCATVQGYKYHLSHDEAPCLLCRVASRAYKNAWKESVKRDQSRATKFRESAAAVARSRRARIRNLDSDSHTTTDVLAKYGTVCYLCNEEIDLLAPRGVGRKPGWEIGLHIEHLLPLRLGGSNTIENVRPAHGLCNLQKGWAILDIALEELTNSLPSF